MLTVIFKIDVFHPLKIRIPDNFQLVQYHAADAALYFMDLVTRFLFYQVSKKTNEVMNLTHSSK